MNEEEKTRKLYEQITKKLIEKHLTISTMESATSGQIASLITDTEGSSAIFPGAFVTYCNDAKVMLGVPRETIDTYGVYSLETAWNMAAASVSAFHTDIGIGVTGTMGNVDPANGDSIPGEVYFAIYYNKRLVNMKITLSPYKTRLEYKLAVAYIVGEHLMEMLERSPE